MINAALYCVPEKSPRVLVVDDHYPCCRLLEIILHRAGCLVVIMKTVEGALFALAQEQFDILICDLLLPDGHGFEIIRAIRDRKLKIFCIAITGLGTPSIETEALKEGFDQFVRKPFKPQAIEALLA